MARKVITKSKTKKEQASILTDEELLAVAKGSKEPKTLGFEENLWIDSSENRKDFIRFRRRVRRGIYKILKNMKRGIDFKDNKELYQLYTVINDQLDTNYGMDWGAFTHKWDIHPKFAMQIVIKEHWVKEGGGYDEEIGTHYPFAFTKQVI